MTKRKRKPIDADTVRVYLCENCGQIHFEMLDADDGIIAEATLPPEFAEELRENIAKALSDVRLQ